MGTFSIFVINNNQIKINWL
ncbi:hypothetical protein H7914_05305 [Staphylococcus epidermidis]|uniref:UORF2 n=1 Tax=Staphylococcus epidermidis TaxID=1282 RepID=Q45V24_STAEP|nr:uORF2 [Staphylococcus epidermidis]MBC3005187.1 hypothetical protein [Staphylococcus epidermidis]MBC3064779.1 hypothetical protein [Staphylococcus epidermidis]